MASGRRVASVIKSMVSAVGLQLECVRVLHESLLVSVFIYGSEKMIRKEKDRPRIRAVQIDNLRGLLSIRVMDIVPNAWIRELCKVTKVLMMVFSDGSAIWRE